MSNVSGLPGIGVASYNSAQGKHVFNATTETTAFRITPVLDAAKRTVTHCIYSITVRELLEPTAQIITDKGVVISP